MNDSIFPVIYPIKYTQQFFLQKAVELKPEITDDLCYLASAEYAVFFLSVQFNRWGFNLNPLRLNNMFVERPFFKAPNWIELVHRLDAVKLRQALLIWAERWNLNAEWCLDSGLRFLDQTRNSQNSRLFFGDQKHNFFYCKQTDREMLFSDRMENSFLIRRLESLLMMRGDLPLPPQGWPEWNPFRETRQAYIHRVIRKVSNAIETDPYLSLANKSRKRGLVNSIINYANQYCNKMEKHRKRADFRSIRLSRNIERNLLWSVKFQVVGMTYTAIADEYIITQKPNAQQTAKGQMSEGIDIATVKKSIDKTLTLLGLRKRPNSGRGRPCHAKDSHSAQIIRRLGFN